MPEYLIENVPLGLIQKVERSYSTYNSNELTSVFVYCKVIQLQIINVSELNIYINAICRMDNA